MGSEEVLAVGGEGTTASRRVSVGRGVRARHAVSPFLACQNFRLCSHLAKPRIWPDRGLGFLDDDDDEGSVP